MLGRYPSLIGKVYPIQMTWMRLQYCHEQFFTSSSANTWFFSAATYEVDKISPSILLIN